MSDAYPATLSLHIDGEWVGTGDRRTHDVVNPATGETLAPLPLADAADMDRALDTAKRAYMPWRLKSADERGAILRKAGGLLRERVNEIARLATLEQGKPIKEAAGETTDDANPNGSLHNIAGICNERRNVVALMPHPERACEPVLGSGDGKVVLDSVVASLRAGAPAVSAR